MRKIYITPEVVAYNITSPSILEGSNTTVEYSSSSNGDNTKEVLSKHGDYSFDDDE